MSNKNHDSRTFIAGFSTMSHMVKLEENMTNLKDDKRKVTVGDSRTFSGTTGTLGMAIRDVMENFIASRYQIQI